MRILFHLGHPAHFHLFKRTIIELKSKGYDTDILIKKKDVLEELLESSQMSFHNLLPTGRKSTKMGIAYGQIKQDLKMLLFCLKKRPDLLVGTSVAISHVGKVLGIPSINVNEDDAEAVPLYAKFTYPWATVILAPFVTSMGKWQNKTINYNGFHELAYLHPNHFTPDINIVKKYIDTNKPYYILRFSNLDAHHDTGISGINEQLAKELISILSPTGNIVITSEREIGQDLEEYRLSIDPIDIHHVIAFATLFIGDSQTMAAEAGVLGTPFIRFNDFVGRIGYLRELEDKYQLGFGIKSANKNQFIEMVKNLVEIPDIKLQYSEKRKKMLFEKIDTSKFLFWFIDNYPESKKIREENQDYQKRFK